MSTKKSARKAPKSRPPGKDEQFEILIATLDRIAVALERLASAEDEETGSSEALVAAVLGAKPAGRGRARGGPGVAAAAAPAGPAAGVCSPAGITALKNAERTVVGGVTKITIQQTSTRLRRMVQCETGFDLFAIPANAPLPNIVGPAVRANRLRPAANGVYYNDVQSFVGAAAMSAAGTPAALLGAVWGGIVRKHP